jgi:hypothetical protein
VINQLSEPAKHVVDYSIGAVGVAFLFKLLPIITGLLALVLIILRIVIGWQEYRLNRRDLNR